MMFAEEGNCSGLAERDCYGLRNHKATVRIGLAQAV
jgi:hypothetical protein